MMGRVKCAPFSCTPALHAGALLLPLLLVAGELEAQTYPAKLVRIVVPLPPGGSNDLAARLVAEKMSAGMGQPVLVDNRPGASGIIATELVAKSAPDGYTLLMANTAHVDNASFFARLPYDPLRDFAACHAHDGSPFRARRASIGSREKREGVHRRRQGTSRCA
jgi:tripartite-type tricarboxylate transporter receptor subunit TctC